MENKYSIKTFLGDLGTCFIAALLVSSSLFFFSNYNAFAPGGVTGFASIFASLIGVGDISSNMSIFMVLLNLPIFILVAIFVSKRTGAFLLVYMSFQASIMMLLKYLYSIKVIPTYYAALETDPNFASGNNLIFAAIGVGVLSGIGFAIMLRHFGASGGTFAISAIIKHFHPEKNIAWLSFAMDASVVFVSLFVFETGINSLIATLLNIFVSDFISDYVVQGGRSGYKYNIITNEPEKLAKELMYELGRGVTLINVTGMYSKEGKMMLMCIIRKKQVGEFLRILKKYEGTFAYSSKVGEVYGNFRDHPTYSYRKSQEQQNKEN